MNGGLDIDYSSRNQTNHSYYPKVVKQVTRRALGRSRSGPGVPGGVADPAFTETGALSLQIEFLPQLSE